MKTQIAAGAAFLLFAASLLFATSSAQAAPGVTGAITYSGIEGPFNNSGLAGTVPANLALNPLNSPGLPTAFASSVILGGTLPFHQVFHLNDGSYSNSRSWIGALANENNVNINVTGVGNVSATFAGINLRAPDRITSFAFGSDNGNYLSGQTDPNEPSNAGDPNENSSGADTGFYHDRTGGDYYVQYTTVSNPNAATSDTDWTTLGKITLAENTNDAYRHVYDLNTPTIVTGLRIIVPGGDRIDELEVFGQTVPEPGSIVALVSLSAMGLIVLSRRRRRAAKGAAD